MNPAPRKKFAESMLESLRINRTILVAALVTTVVSLIVFASSSYDANVTRLLQLSPTNPWGVFTSIFVHSNAEHITSNIIFLWLWTLYIIIMPESFLSWEQRMIRAKFFIPAMYAVAIVTNIAFVNALIWVRPDQPFTSQGASGLVYGFSGGVFAIALMNIIHIYPKLKDAAFAKREVIGAILLNLVIVGMIFALVTIMPDTFLSKAPGSNVFAHGVAFLLGIGAVMGREYHPSFKNAAAPVIDRVPK